MKTPTYINDILISTCTIHNISKTKQNQQEKVHVFHGKTIKTTRWKTSKLKLHIMRQ